MTTMVFLHGKESGPGGTKARWLAERYGAVTPALATETVGGALPTARAAIEAHRPRVVVASSFGGAVAVTLLREGVIRVPVVLIAPAAHKLGVENALPPGARAVILHGDRDDVVPLADSVALAATGGPGVRLHVVEGGDHRLNTLLGTFLEGVIAELAATEPG
jgi:alpha/beta superfamily hydrolase